MVTGKTHDHYKSWSAAQVVVRPEGPVGRTFYAARASYNFTAPQLLDVVKHRMLVNVRIARKWGLEAARIFEYCFSDGAFIGPPKYTGEAGYWDALRAKISAKCEELKTDMTEVAFVGGDISYGEKELRADLRELKVAAREKLPMIS